MPLHKQNQLLVPSRLHDTIGYDTFTCAQKLTTWPA